MIARFSQKGSRIEQQGQTNEPGLQEWHWTRDQAGRDCQAGVGCLAEDECVDASWLENTSQATAVFVSFIEEV